MSVFVSCTTFVRCLGAGVGRRASTRARGKPRLAILRLAGWATALLAAPAAAAQISLDDALRLALERHPDVRIAETELRAAEGELVRARTYPFNPDLAVEGGRKSTPGSAESRGSASEFSLDQTLELGKRGPRIAAASARRSAAEARVAQIRLLVLSGARRAYLLAIAARNRVQTTREAEAVAEELKAFSAERLRLGAGTQLLYNVAAAAAGRARADRLAAERRYRTARADLAAAVFAEPGEPPEPIGDFPLPAASPPGSADDFVRRALAQRADLRAVRQERLATQSEVALAKRLAIPDPIFGARLERRPDERTFLFGVTVPLPFFNRNQGGIAVARALESRAGTIEQAQERAVDREARAAYEAYRLALEAALGFDRDVTDRLSENLELARESLRAGKISLLEFNVVRRDLVDTRLAYLDALAELVEARFALELATGGSLE